MKLQEIKAAVMAGKTVHWSNSSYVVIYATKIDQFLIHCTSNDNYIGLTHRDGVTMNGAADEFYTASISD